MIDITGLREDKRPQSSTIVHALLDRLEAAEKEREIDEERIADLMADLNRVGHENDALRAMIAEKVISQTMLRDLNVGNGSINACFEGGAAHLLVDALANQFVESGAVNYLEMQFHSNVTGPLLLTLQRVNGKTPHQLRAEAEQERDDVAQQLVQSEQGKRKISEECDALRAESAALVEDMNLLRNNNVTLRAKITEMERQEPYSYIYEYANPIDGSPVWRNTPGYWNAQYPRSSKPLYALPGAKGE